MRPFEYARPATEAEAVEFLSEHDGQTAVLAGGTDLLNLLKQDVVTAKRLRTSPGLDCPGSRDTGCPRRPPATRRSATP